MSNHKGGKEGWISVGSRWRCALGGNGCAVAWARSFGGFLPKAPFLPPACNTWLGGACKRGTGATGLHLCQMYTVNTVEGKYLFKVSQGFTAKSEIRYVTSFVFINIIVCVCSY